MMRATRPDPCTFPTSQRRGAGIILAILSVLFLLGMVVARPVQAQTTYTILHSFAGGSTDGATPNAGVIVDKDGNLYGTTIGGGGGAGTVFKVNAAGSESLVYRFPVSFYYSYGGYDCFLHPVIYAPKGSFPYSLLVMGVDGNLYGTTAYGGANGYECNPSGYGTSGDGAVFELNPSNSPPTETVVHSFTSQVFPYGSPGLAIDLARILYGTSMDGGASNVFKLDTSSNFSVLVSSAGGSVVIPDGQMIVDGSGNLYGTSVSGLTSGDGEVLELVNSSGTYTEKILYTFAGGIDGSGPSAPLIMDSAGNLYGVTSSGGGSANCFGGCGTVFELINSSGSYTKKTLYAFPGGSAGADPRGSLVVDAAGDLYGTAMSGGDTSLNNGYGAGAVFEVDPSGRETVLHAFGTVTNDGNDGEGDGGLAMDAAGNLYGTTPGGGADGHGIGFKITTAQSAAAAIISQVNALASQSGLKSGQITSLVNELQQAVSMTNAGNAHGAIGILEGFIAHVNGLLNSGALTSNQASGLTNAANGVVAQLQAM